MKCCHSCKKDNLILLRNRFEELKDTKKRNTQKNIPFSIYTQTLNTMKIDLPRRTETLSSYIKTLFMRALESISEGYLL